MSYTSRDRDRSRLAVAAVTGIGAVGAFTATGWSAGEAASDLAAQQASSAGSSPVAEQQDETSRSRGPLRQRRYVTRVTVRYVPAAGGSVVPGPGSTVVPDRSGSSGPSTDSSGPGPAPEPPPPAPEPPAPSSGS